MAVCHGKVIEDAKKESLIKKNTTSGLTEQVFIYIFSLPLNKYVFLYEKYARNDRRRFMRDVFI